MAAFLPNPPSCVQHHFSAFHFGLGWTTATGLLGYLIAMGVGASAGILAGKPPWKQAAWIESLLKAVAGLGVGALLYWVSSKWAAFGLPFGLIPGLEEGTPWTEAPLLVSAAVGAVYGTLIELDNTPDGGATPKREGKKGAKARVAAGADLAIADAELVEDAGATREL